MSEYLGWRDRKPAVGYDRRSEFDRTIIPGGIQTKSYENYVKNIFHPMNRLKDNDKKHLSEKHGITASKMLKVEQEFGRGALDDKYDHDHYFEKMPLENLYQELGLKNPNPTSYRSFQVYEPKQSSEYFATSHEAERERRRRELEKELELLDKDDSVNDEKAYRTLHSAFASYRPPLSSNRYQTKEDEDYEKNNKKTLIDYKDFDSFPLSPYLYQSHPYVRNQDSRIVGSNFVQLTSRPKDKFISKIEETLAMVRDMPRY